MGTQVILLVWLNIPIYPCNDTIATELATQFTQSPKDSDTPNEGY